MYVAFLDNSHWLKSLYKNGYLKKVLSLYKKYINKSHHISTGTQVATFKYKGKILKLTPKSIKFFKTYDDFKSTINGINTSKYDFFTSVIDVIYTDDYIFLYLQNKCKIIKNTSPYIALSILLLLIRMINSNKLITDLHRANIGIYNNNVVLIDYHGLISTTGNINCSRLIKNTIYYIEKYTDYSPSLLKNIFESNDLNLISNTLLNLIFTPMYNKYNSKLSSIEIEILNDKKNNL